MGNFKIGDKVVFKKEVLDKINKNESAESLVGITLDKNYYDYLMRNSNFKELGYFEVQGFGKFVTHNLCIGGLYLGKDLFEYYQEKDSYRIGYELTIGDYKGFISKDGVGYYLDFGPRLLEHREVCSRLKKLFGTNVFISTARKCGGCIDSSSAFPNFKYMEDLVTFVNKLNKLLINSNKKSDSITIKKYQNNEIRFQKPKASSKRGVVPAGSTISGRKDKIAISIGHLSYQVCNC